MSQPRLALLLCLVLVLEGTSGSFLKPLTCRLDNSEKKICGGEAEIFYPHQCLLKGCCYKNNSCYYHVIDGDKQRRNAGILGGILVTIILLMCLFFSWRFRELQRKEKVSEPSRSGGEMADYLVKLLDDESEADDYKGHEILDSWAQGNYSPEPGGGGGAGQQWSPELSPEVSPEPIQLAEPPTPEPAPAEAPPPPPEPPPPSPPPEPAPAEAPAPPPPPPEPAPAPGPPGEPAPAGAPPPPPPPGEPGPPPAAPAAPPPGEPPPAPPAEPPSAPSTAPSAPSTAPSAPSTA